VCVKFTGVGSALPADKLEQVVTRQSVSLRGKVCLHCLSHCHSLSSRQTASSVVNQENQQLKLL